MIPEVASFLSQVLPGPVYHVLDWPMNTGPNGAYNFWSGIAGGSILFTGFGLWRHTRCDAPLCVRRGRHQTADGHHKLCRPHHPDLPNHRLSLSEIRFLHHEAQRDES